VRPTEAQYLAIRNYFYKGYPEDMMSLDEFRLLISPFRSDINFCIVSKIDEGLYINWMYVHETFRGKGIGKKMYAKLIEWAESRGYKEITLHIHWVNFQSLAAAIKSNAKIIDFTVFLNGSLGYELKIELKSNYQNGKKTDKQEDQALEKG